MSSSYSAVSDTHNYFVWPDTTALTASYQSKDTLDALFITNRSPAYVSSNCSCNGFKSYFTTATPKASFTFGAWGKYSVNGTQVLFDTTIDLSCSKSATGDCILTLHDSDGSGYNGWGTPLATVGYLEIKFNGNGLEKGILPTQYAEPTPTTYIYPPGPTAKSTSSSVQSSVTSTAASSDVSSSVSSPALGATSQGLALATAASSSATSTSAPSTTQSKSSTSKGLIAGVSVGASVLFLLALLAIWFLFRRKKSAQNQRRIPDFALGLPRHSVTHEKLASDVALVEIHSTTPSPSNTSPSSMGFQPGGDTPMMTPETLRDFIAAASLDQRTTMDPPARLILPGDEPSALIYNIWDAIAVRETYVSRLNPSLTIPSTLESLRKQAMEIAERTTATPPVMLAATSTPFRGDTVGWSESNRFKHTFAFSGGTGGVPKKRLVVRRGDSVDGTRGKKFQTHETWAVGNCTECQCYRGVSDVVKASVTVYVGDGAEVEACKNCQVLVDGFKKLHSMEAVDQNTVLSDKEAQRAELARQAVEREWERMESEYSSREKGAVGRTGG